MSRIIESCASPLAREVLLVFFRTTALVGTSESGPRGLWRLSAGWFLAPGHPAEPTWMWHARGPRFFFAGGSHSSVCAGSGRPQIRQRAAWMLVLHKTIRVPDRKIWPGSSSCPLVASACPTRCAYRTERMREPPRVFLPRPPRACQHGSV